MLLDKTRYYAICTSIKAAPSLLFGYITLYLSLGSFVAPCKYYACYLYGGKTQNLDNFSTGFPQIKDPQRRPHLSSMSEGYPSANLLLLKRASNAFTTLLCGAAIEGHYVSGILP